MPLFIPRRGVNITASEAVRALASLPLNALVDEEAVAQVEEAFARQVGVEHAIAVASGRYGFHLVLRSLGLSPKDEVVMPSLTIPPMPNAVLWSASLRFADVSAATYTLDPTAAREACTPDTKVLVPTHLFGCPCDMGAIGDLAEDRGLRVVEDCAHALGARYRGRHVGSLGDAAIFSMATGKHVTAFGGGMVTTNDDAIAASVREGLDAAATPSRVRLAKAVVKDTAIWALTSQPLFSLVLFPGLAASSLLSGESDPFAERLALLDELPDEYRGTLASLQSSKALSSLRYLEGIIARRRANAESLVQALADVPGLMPQQVPEGATHAYLASYWRVVDREGVMRRLLRQGIDTRASPMLPCASLPMFEGHNTPCPTADILSRELVNLPIRQTLGEGDMARIARAVRRAIDAR